MTELRLPELAPGMNTATLATWLKKEGDVVAAGQPVAEIETDKTSVELEAPCAGVLAKLHVPAGTTVAIGALLADIDEAVSTEPSSSAGPLLPSAAMAATPASDASKPRGVSEASTVGTRPGPAAEPAPLPRALDGGSSPSAATPTARAAHGTVREATPLAARMAQFAGLDLASLPPTADNRPLGKAEVDAALGLTGGFSRQGRTPTATPSAPLTPTTSSAVGPYEDRPLSSMRRATAARLQFAKQTIPHFYLETVVSADALMAAREHANAKRRDGKLTVTDILVFAAAQALREVPAVNAAWAEEAIRVFGSVDIAVAVNTPKGLVTPVIRQCQNKTLGGLSRELKTLAARAREGTLGPAEYTGGSFTISNLGMYDVTSITPILNPPQCAILGVGAIETRPVVINGALAVGRVMHCTLAADHRVIDGATGAEFLSALKRWLEEPMAMALQV
jgi:pyruvate dehydrogenase E2 component (dihydrolipoamide acetyltransferase)